jgi:hypothetical protein
MDPIEWLRQRLQGFPPAHEGELLKAITDFALLWGFFEGMALGTDGYQDRIAQRVRDWHRVLYFQIGDFADHLEYFRTRYCPNGNWDPEYDMLRRLNRNNELLVTRVLERRTQDPMESVTP